MHPSRAGTSAPERLSASLCSGKEVRGPDTMPPAHIYYYMQHTFFIISLDAIFRRRLQRAKQVRRRDMTPWAPVQSELAAYSAETSYCILCKDDFSSVALSAQVPRSIVVDKQRPG